MAENTRIQWCVVPPPWDDTGCMVATGEGDPHGQEIICRTDEGRWHDHTREDEARWQRNARLIAAAPVMALIVEMLTRAVDAEEPTHGGFVDAAIETALEIAPLIE